MRGRVVVWTVMLALVAGAAVALPWLRSKGLVPSVSRPVARTGLTDVTLEGSIRADGVIEVAQRMTFADERGGPVAVPPACGPTFLTFTGCTREISIDGRPVRGTESVQSVVLRVPGPTATLRYELDGTTRGYTDIAYLQALVLPGQPEASPGGPAVRLRGRFRLPPGARGAQVEPYIFAADRDRTAVARGRQLAFSADTTPYEDIELHAALPPTAVPGLPDELRIPAEGRMGFDITADVRSRVSDAAAGAGTGILDAQRIIDLVVGAVGYGIAALLWVVAIGVGLFRRRPRSPLPEVPRTLEDPPGPEDPAIVSVLVRRGRAGPEAVAGNALALADRRVLDIQQLSGDRFVVRVLDPSRGGYAADVLLVEQLRLASAPDGTVEGPPVWHQPRRWWRSFRHDATQRAKLAGLIRTMFPPVLVGMASIWTGVAVGMNAFLSDPAMFAIVVLVLAVGGQVLSVASGYALTDYGRLQRERWRAYGRYLEQFEQLDHVGPGGVVIWGSKLAYGAVLGAAGNAARSLAPDV
ncbi:MAG: DUF2207 domain-containing protein [Actinomycetota bacterium]|nr:DUF2207 domain-containing protein [Actinomycetota bacterium]